MKNLKNLNTTTMIALTLLLSTGVSSLNIDNFGQIVNVSYASSNTLKVKINTKSSNLNVRKEPNANSAILTSIPKGKVVTVEATNGAWYKVTYNSKTGWILREYTTPESGTSSNTTGTAAAANTKGKVVTQGGNLTMRKDTSTASEKVGSIPNGTSVDILRYTNGWFQVKYNGATGWCSRSYIPDSTVTPAISKNNNSTTSKTDTSSSSSTTPESGTPSNTIGAAAAANTKGKVVTQGGNLTMRKDTSTASEKVGSIPNGTSVDILRYTNGWFQVKYNGATGWCSRSYIPDSTVTPAISKNNNSTTSKIDTSSSSSTNNSTNNTGGSNIDYSKPAPSDTGLPITGTKTFKINKNVNVRIGPSTKYNSSTTYKAGTEVEVERRYTNASENRTWFKIKGKNLWVASEFLDAYTQTSSNKVTNKKSISLQVRPKSDTTIGSKDINNVDNTKITFKTFKTNIYNAVEEATVNNIRYFKIQALSSNTYAWIPAVNFNDVTSSAKFKLGSKYRIQHATYLYNKSDLKNKTKSGYMGILNQKVKINHISSNKTAVNITIISPNEQGWVNKGALKTGEITHSDITDLENISIKDMFSDVYALNSETQALRAQSADDNEDYTKIIGMPSKPYLVQLDISPDQSEPVYVEQYFVDITAKDNTVTTLRFAPSDFNLIKSLYSGQEVTLYADPSTTEDPESLPMFVVGYDFIDSNSDVISYSHIEPLSDAEIVAIMAEDFSNFLNSYGVTVEKFSQEDIDAIVKEINNPKVDKNSATIGGEDEDSTDNTDSVKNDNKSNNSSSSFRGMKSKFNF